jgi:predicted YcjX-like family ATPase
MQVKSPDWRSKWLDSANQLFEKITRREKKIIITGLSRSGKSVFFTSLIYLLKARVLDAESARDDLPLLHQALPKSRLQKVKVCPLEDVPPFPYEEALASLKQGRWPEATREISGFELQIQLKNTHPLTKHLQPTETLAFQFYDYPGEWLTDLPMLGKDYLNWSNQLMAEQHSLPLKLFSADWLAAIEAFDFSQSPSLEAMQSLQARYAEFIRQAKAGGITLLQPAGVLVNTTAFDFQQAPLFPLPSHIACEAGHPWTVALSRHFTAYLENWLRPLQEQYFQRAEQQLVLVDLFEGLNYGQNQLRQLRQTLSQLATTFVYGRSNWLKRLFGKTPGISKVAFAATKMDLAPFSQQANLLALLKDVTAGAQSQFGSQEVSFAHFCLSAMRVTKQEDEASDAVIFQTPEGEVLRMAFEPLPKSIHEIGETQAFAPMQTKPSAHWETQLRASQGMDSLLNYLLENQP